MKQQTSQPAWPDKAKRWGPAVIGAVLVIAILAIAAPKLLAYTLVAGPLIGLVAYILATNLKWPPK